MQYSLNNDYIGSTVLISDVKEFSFPMLSKLNPILVHKGFTILTVSDRNSTIEQFQDTLHMHKSVIIVELDHSRYKQYLQKKLLVRK